MSTPHLCVSPSSCHTLPAAWLALWGSTGPARAGKSSHFSVSAGLFSRPTSFFPASTFVPLQWLLYRPCSECLKYTKIHSHLCHRATGATLWKLVPLLPPRPPSGGSAHPRCVTALSLPVCPASRAWRTVLGPAHACAWHLLEVWWSLSTWQGSRPGPAVEQSMRLGLPWCPEACPVAAVGSAHLPLNILTEQAVWLLVEAHIFVLSTFKEGGGREGKRRKG